MFMMKQTKTPGHLQAKWQNSQQKSLRKTYYLPQQERVFCKMNPKIGISPLLLPIWIRGCGLRCPGLPGNMTEISETSFTEYLQPFALLTITSDTSTRLNQMILQRKILKTRGSRSNRLLLIRRLYFWTLCPL